MNKSINHKISFRKKDKANLLLEWRNHKKMRNLKYYLVTNFPKIKLILLVLFKEK